MTIQTAAPTTATPAVDPNETKAPLKPGAKAGAPGAAPKPIPVSMGGPGAKPEVTEAPKETPAQAAKRKYRIKVDGAEQELELGDEEVSVRLQKSMAAEKRMQEAADIRKQWQQLKEVAKSDPSVLFKELLGMDPNEWAESRVAEKWKLEVMPEHERKVYELEQKIKAYEGQESKRKAAEAAAVETREREALESQMEKDFKRAFEVSGLDWTPDNVEVFGKIVLDAHDYNLELTPEQMAAEAKSQIAARESKFRDVVKGNISGLKGSALLEELGEATVKEVLRAALEKYNPAPTPATEAFEPVTKPSATLLNPPAKRQPKSPADWRKTFGR